jgi:hypothetical protein
MSRSRKRGVTTVGGAGLYSLLRSHLRFAPHNATQLSKEFRAVKKNDEETCTYVIAL